MSTSTQARVRSSGFGATIARPYEQALERTRAVLKDQGFGVLTEIDVKQTMEAKLDVDFRPYVILGACNPPLAHRALSADLGIGLLLPCNVVVYDNGDGTSTVEMMDSFDIFDWPRLMLGNGPPVVRARPTLPTSDGRLEVGCAGEERRWICSRRYAANTSSG